MAKCADAVRCDHAGSPVVAGSPANADDIGARVARAFDVFELSACRREPTMRPGLFARSDERRESARVHQRRQTRASFVVRIQQNAGDLDLVCDRHKIVGGRRRGNVEVRIRDQYQRRRVHERVRCYARDRRGRVLACRRIPIFT